MGWKKKKVYFTDEINKLQAHSENKNIRNLY